MNNSKILKIPIFLHLFRVCYLEFRFLNVFSKTYCNFKFSKLFFKLFRVRPGLPSYRYFYRSCMKYVEICVVGCLLFT